MLTYQTQAEKIIQAYLKEEIRPYTSCACFIGNLLNNTDDWTSARECRTIKGIDMMVPAKFNYSSSYNEAFFSI